MDIIHCLALESLPKMQAQSLFLLITHKGLRPNSESRLPQCPFLGFQYPFEKKRTAKANPTTRFHYQRETLQKKMQNTRRNTLVFVQGLPKCLRAFPQRSGHASHQDGSRQKPRVPSARLQGGRRGRPRQAQLHPRSSRAHLPSLAGLRRRWSRLWAASRVLRKKLFYLQNSEVLLARLASCCFSWAPRASFLTVAPPPPFLPCSALPFGQSQDFIQSPTCTLEKGPRSSGGRWERGLDPALEA